MLHHNSNSALQPIFSTSILHNDICIKASKVSNFNEAHQWPLIAFYFEYPLSQIATLEGMTSVLPKFHEMWPIGVSLVDAPQNCHALYNDLFSHSCLKVSTNSSNPTLFTSLSTTANPNFMINLSNHCYDIVI